jgi:UDP-GlcNAc:undecaprenyl-phosphate GlcNAc-1-phosphate transferase
LNGDILLPLRPTHSVVEVLADKWWIGLLSLAVGLIATPIVRAIAYRRKIVDKPDDLLKPHGRPVAYLGGLAMFAGLLSGLAGYLLVMPNLADHWRDLTEALVRLHWSGPSRPPALVDNPLWQLLAIVVACALIMMIGLVDDLRSLKPRQKIYGQLAAAGILLAGGIADTTSITILGPIFEWAGAQPPQWLVFSASAVMCVIIVIGACNAANLLDGMDGLCGGVTAIIALGFLALAIWLAVWKNTSTDGIRVCLCLSMAGAVLGFLPYNLPPASIFMGDAGSMLLGFFVAVMMCLFSIEGTARWLVASAVVFSLPILDTGLAVVRRLASGKSIVSGDRSHLYDQLQDRGMTIKQVVALFYLLSSAAAVIGVTGAILLRLRDALPIYLVLLTVVILIFLLLGMMTPPPKDRKT